MDKDVCQECYWTGREGNGHKNTHQVREYCFPVGRLCCCQDVAACMAFKSFFFLWSFSFAFYSSRRPRRMSRIFSAASRRTCPSGPSARLYVGPIFRASQQNTVRFCSQCESLCYPDHDRSCPRPCRCPCPTRRHKLRPQLWSRHRAPHRELAPRTRPSKLQMLEKNLQSSLAFLFMFVDLACSLTDRAATTMAWKTSTMSLKAWLLGKLPFATELLLLSSAYHFSPLTCGLRHQSAGQLRRSRRWPSIYHGREPRNGAKAGALVGLLGLQDIFLSPISIHPSLLLPHSLAPAACH